MKWDFRGDTRHKKRDTYTSFQRDVRDSSSRKKAGSVVGEEDKPAGDKRRPGEREHTRVENEQGAPADEQEKLHAGTEPGIYWGGLAHTTTLLQITHVA